MPKSQYKAKKIIFDSTEFFENLDLILEFIKPFFIIIEILQLIDRLITAFRKTKPISSWILN